MKCSQRIWIVFTMLFGLEGLLAGQAAVEYGLGAGRAATSTAPARGVAKSIEGLAGSLDKALNAGQESSTKAIGSPARSRVVGPTAPATVERNDAAASPAPAAAVPAPTYEDPAIIQAGIARAELVRRFGPPAFEVTGASSLRMLTYSSKSGLVQLDLQDDKVVRVAASKPPQSGIVLPR